MSSGPCIVQTVNVRPLRYHDGRMNRSAAASGSPWITLPVRQDGLSLTQVQPGKNRVSFIVFSRNPPHDCGGGGGLVVNAFRDDAVSEIQPVLLFGDAAHA